MEWDFSDWYPSKKDILACREVCSGCPIRQQCLDYAVVNERYGFWGGSTAAERGQARKRKRIGPGKEAV
jgi:WhiB family redox-sensing transcriptional regulator